MSLNKNKNIKRINYTGNGRAWSNVNYRTKKYHNEYYSKKNEDLTGYKGKLFKDYEGRLSFNKTEDGKLNIVLKIMGEDDISINCYDRLIIYNEEDLMIFNERLIKETRKDYLDSSILFFTPHLSNKLFDILYNSAEKKFRAVVFKH